MASASIKRTKKPSKSAVVDTALQVGTRIDFGDDGEGKITANDAERIFIESPVFTGWINEASFRRTLLPNTDD